jgi:hypothetical protein
LGGPLSKLCVTPPFSINFRCQIENQVSDYPNIKDCSCLIKFVLRCLYIEDGNRFMFLTEISNGGNRIGPLDLKVEFNAILETLLAVETWSDE